jgi:thioredoxin reductase
MSEPAGAIDVAVIGAGPAGLAVALVLGRAARPSPLVDAGPGRNQPATAVHGYLGHDGTSPTELRRVARREISTYPTTTVVEDRVTAISGADGSFVVELANGPAYQTRRVVLATGVADDLPPI